MAASRRSEMHLYTEEHSHERRHMPLWLMPSQVAAAAIAWAITSGGQALRGLFLGALVWLIALPLLVSLEAGLIAMMLFEPVRGLLRRAQYVLVPYEGLDPIHLLTPLITLLAFATVLRAHRFRIFRLTPLAGLVSLLGAIYFVQIFNPLQGGVVVGLSGALFMLVPMAWFYFGQVVSLNFVATALRLMIVIGLVTSLHGLYQTIFGFPDFEQYWVDRTEFYSSISVGNVQRALATFSSAEEWARYITFGALVAFGFGVGAKRRTNRVAYLLAGATLSVVLLLTGQRTSIFALLLGVATFIVLGSRTWSGMARRGGLMLVCASLVVALAEAPSLDDMLERNSEEVSETMLSHSMRGTLRPTAEGSLEARLENWTYLVTAIVPSNPLGMGLGATSVGMKRFNAEGDEALRETDGYVIGLVISCGLPVALLCLWILWRAAQLSWRAHSRTARGTPNAALWRVVASLMPVLIFTSVFANTLTLYSVAPLAWLLIGWVSAEAAPSDIEGSVRTEA